MQCETLDNKETKHPQNDCILYCRYSRVGEALEDLLSIGKENQTASHCPQSHIKKDELSQYTKARIRSLKETICFLRQNDKNAFGEVLPYVPPYSLHPVMPVFSTFPSMRIRSSVDVYSVFDFDTMHVFPPGNREILKECLVAKLSNPLRTTILLKTKLRSCRTFIAVKRFMLQSSNRFLNKNIIRSTRIWLK